MTVDRRTFLQLLTTGAAAATFPASIAKALAIPANNRTGTIEDVEHIVFMMQENRSFDHYFGTLRGVRGFGDPRAIRLPNGKQVWYQPNPDSPDGYTLPFHPGAPNLGLQFLQDLAHDWTSTHGAWNGGKYDQWVPNKSALSMAHLTRSDIPFHYALADAFTVCDAYHCSLLGPTDPNRYHMWTGWVGNDGTNGGPVIDNAELGYDWSTYPERLQKAGISWKIYQDQGAGLDAAHYWGWGDDAYIGNYGDNSLLYFHQYQNAPANSPLAEKARTGTDIAQSGTLFDAFAADVKNGTLPQVSWVVAPEAYTEHPNWPANYGAWYVSNILDALTANPKVWSKTAFIWMFDENDGFFDHVVPPTPPATRSEGFSTVSIENEIFTGSAQYPTTNYPAGPYGLGVRVPMIVVSPWSKGGYVNSEVFDHTSLIRFIERRFGKNNPELNEPNITEWRREVTGDLTSIFNFRNPNDAVVPLPSTVAYEPPDNNRHPNYSPAPPDDQTLPTQEPGTRPARALPYELNLEGQIHFAENRLRVVFHNTGKATAVFQVRSGDTQNGPWSYTVSPRAEAFTNWYFAATQQYDFSVYGPNGFFRTFKGKTSDTGANLDVCAEYDCDGLAITLSIENPTSTKTAVTVVDGYTNKKISRVLEAGGRVRETWPLLGSFGWYDLTVTAGSDASFERRVAGHIENGRDSITDPAIARS
jgi:phospholipase C